MPNRQYCLNNNNNNNNNGKNNNNNTVFKLTLQDPFVTIIHNYSRQNSPIPLEINSP